MRLPIAACLISLLSFAASTPGWAQIIPADAGRLGMEIAWQSQLPMPKLANAVVSTHLWVNAADAGRKLAVVDLPEGRTVRIDANQLDSRGNPIGMEEAKKRAGEQAARLLGKNEGFNVVEVTVPAVQLVVITKTGLVQTFDAETGHLLWSTALGSVHAPTHPGAVSTEGVSLIHGTELFLLDWASGRRLMTTDLEFGSAMSVAVCNGLVYISDFRGRLRAHALGANRKPWTTQIIGRVVGQPVTLPDQSYCAMATTGGYVYILNSGENPGMHARYETSSSLTGSLAAGNGAFYAGTSSGLLSKINVAARTSNLAWEFPAGRPLSAPPLVVGTRVVAVTESGDVICLDEATGAPIWELVGQPIAQAVGMAAGKFLCATTSGGICAFDAETGALIGSSLPASAAAVVVNQVHDRLYVVGREGQLQCWRPQGGVLPKLIAPPVTEEGEGNEESPPATAPVTPAAPASNPFGTQPTTPAGNPFGSDPAATGNPFGTDPAADGNPAGGGAPAAGGNPFGTSPAPAGDANPFGAGQTAPAEAGDSSNPFGSSDMSNPFGGANPF